MKLVIYPPIPPERLDLVRAAASEARVVSPADEAAALAEIADADGFYGKITPALLAAAGRLRWIQSPTASLEHYVFPDLVEHPCILTNMRGLYSDVIADHVLGYILCFARNLHRYIRQQMRGEWAPIGADRATPNYGLGQSQVGPLDRAHMHLSDATVGIVGLGAIGEEIGRRASAFGMRVIAVDPRRTDCPAGVEWLRGLDALDALLAESTFVVVAAPHTPDTEGMFGAERFARMRADGYFINIGRGAIVSLDALVEALQAHRIAGAALDVYEIEPLPADHPLWAMENVILTPHVASASVHIAGRHEETLLENVRRFVAGEELLNVTDKGQWF